MSQSKAEKYKSYKYLDEPIRYFALKPWTEILPCLVFGLIGFLVGTAIDYAYIGIFAGFFTCLVSVKILEYRLGKNWLVRIIYWNIPKRYSRQFFTGTPPAENSHYIGRK